MAEKLPPVGSRVQILTSTKDSAVTACLGCVGVVTRLDYQRTEPIATVLLDKPHPHWRDELYVCAESLLEVQENVWLE